MKHLLAEDNSLACYKYNGDVTRLNMNNSVNTFLQSGQYCLFCITNYTVTVTRVENDNCMIRTCYDQSYAMFVALMDIITVIIGNQTMKLTTSYDTKTKLF